MKRWGEALAKIVGREHVRLGGSVVSPASPAELAAVLRRCGELGARVRLPGRGVDERPGRSMTLDLERIHSRPEVEPKAMVVRAPAGIPLRALERELAQSGLSIGPIAERDPDVALGTLLQRPEAGDRSPRYGRFVDQCIGLEAVLPDGSIAAWRASPRKAAGPDWRALALGGGWVAAVVTSASLRVHALPETRRSLAFSFPSRRNALEAAREAVRREVRPATWWCSTTISAQLEGPAAIVEAEARAFEEVARSWRGKKTGLSRPPRTPSHHTTWTHAFEGRGAVSEMTLDGGCLHGRALPTARPSAALSRALDPKGVLIWGGA